MDNWVEFLQKEVKFEPEDLCNLMIKIMRFHSNLKYRYTDIIITDLNKTEPTFRVNSNGFVMDISVGLDLDPDNYYVKYSDDTIERISEDDIIQKIELSFFNSV